MFLPKQILALKRILARAVGRSAYPHVRVERTAEGPRAMATDGRRAVVFSWDEPAAGQFPPIEGTSSAPAQQFAANVPSRTLAEAGRGVGRRTGRRTADPALAHLLLDESDSSLVRLAARDGERVTRAQAEAGGGTFPDCASVLPAPAREGTLYEPARHGKAPFTHTRIGVNAKQLAQTLGVVSDLAADDPNHTVVMTVPVDPDRPLRLDARCAGRRAAAAIMPVRAAFADYDERVPARRPPPRPALPPAPGPEPVRAREIQPASDAAPGGAVKRPSRRRSRSKPQIAGSSPDRQGPTI